MQESQVVNALYTANQSIIDINSYCIWYGSVQIYLGKVKKEMLVALIVVNLSLTKLFNYASTLFEGRSTVLVDRGGRI